MYQVFYGKNLLHDPRSDSTLIGAKLELEVNSSNSFTFKIAHNHPAYGLLAEKNTKNLITVYSDGVLFFRGWIVSIKADFNLIKQVTCQSDLAWLNDSIVRPYSTLETECDNVAPNTVDGYFRWLIEQHNAQVEPTKQFTIGVNEGNWLDPNNYIYRSDSNYPNTGSVIKDKILDSLGGYIRTRVENGVAYVDLLADFTKVNAQLIDFGVNLLDFTKEDIADDIATYVVPLGETIEDEEQEEDTDKVQLHVDISSLDDGVVEFGYIKKGDIIYSDAAVKRSGWIGAVIEFSDVSEAENLLSKGVLGLKEIENASRTIELSAVDLAKIKPEYEPFSIGQYIRARSKPHDFDSYMLCTKIELNLLEADADTFTLGTTFDSLTGIQNKRINSLNGTINKVYERAATISGQALTVANEAQKVAEGVSDIAEEAKTTAASAQTAIDNLEIGGRNLLVYKTITYATGYGHDDLCADSDTGIITGTGRYYLAFDVELEPNTDYTVSVKKVETSGDFDNFCSIMIYDFEANAAVQVVGIIKSGESIVFSTVDAVDSDKRFIVYVTSGTSTAYVVNQIKLEKGNKVTDWTPAPEDVSTDISNVGNEAAAANKKAASNETRIDDAIASLTVIEDSAVVFKEDENGNKALVQGSGENSFSITDLQNTLDETGGRIEDISTEIAGVQTSISSVNTELDKYGAYIEIDTTQESPQILLGKKDDAEGFKVCITNERIDFLVGSTVPAYISNEALNIDKATIEGELEIANTSVVEGSWVWVQRSNGNLGLMWKGV